MMAECKRAREIQKSYQGLGLELLDKNHWPKQVTWSSPKARGRKDNPPPMTPQCGCRERLRIGVNNAICDLCSTYISNSLCTTSFPFHCSKHTGLFSLPQMQQALSHSGAFAQSFPLPKRVFSSLFAGEFSLSLLSSPYMSFP